MIPGSVTPLLLKSAAAGGLQIERSLRFNSSDSGFLSRVPGTAGNRRTWTWSGWVKRSVLGGSQLLFAVNASNDDAGVAQIFFDNSNAIRYGINSGEPLVTTAVYRDVSAWYHVLFAYDTTNATAADRYILYVNGVRQTTSTYTAPSQNFEGGINRTSAHAIGRREGNNDLYFNGYLTNIHFIDGQALTPSSFTETDATTGQLIPKTYSGSYGTNGFNLLFADNSSNTAATLGKDTSGNSNNWTPNNLSVTAGVGNDSLVDSPTNYGTDTGVGGEVRGNYCTWNPLDLAFTTLANGNLQASGSTNVAGVTGTIGVSSGKWYWEVTSGSNYDTMGIWSTSSRITGDPGSTSDSYGYFGGSGQKINNNAGPVYGATFTSGDVIGIALDLDAGTITFYKNGASQGIAFSGLTGGFRPAIRAGAVLYPSTGTYLNAGQRAFAYTAPSGFKALCTQNLPAPLVAKSNTVFDVKLYTGTGSTQSITGLEFNPDFLWFKSRSSANDHVLFDAVRGRASGLRSNGTDAEYTSSAGNDLASFDSAGFTVGAPQNWSSPNGNGNSVVAWAWDAGTSTVSNTQGSITSQVRANATAGFSVVTYTGTGVNATVGHGLGVAPKLFIVKRRDTTANWIAHTTAIDGTYDYLYLNLTNAKADSSLTAPTSTVFEVGNGAEMNASGGTYVGYCFSSVVGYSSFGSYTGNGLADGPFVYTGFRPRWIMFKSSSYSAAATSWAIWDTARDSSNVITKFLQPDNSSAEGSVSYGDILSNGFKFRFADTNNNASGQTYIYAAFAEMPFNYSRAR